MFVLLTSKWRRRAAAFVAVLLYAFCLLVPTMAFAMSEETVPAHCLTMTDEHQTSADHAAHHDAGMIHDEPAGEPASGDHHHHALPGKCCGLFSVAAIAPSFEAVTAPTSLVSDMAMPSVTSLLGRSAARIDRPPRSLSTI